MLNEISARQLILLLILAMVFVPEALASYRAVRLDYLIWTGTTKSITVSENGGITLKILKDSLADLFVPYFNRGVHAIEGLDASREKIANLDDMNPFPALFLAPDPKGVWVWWDFRSHYTAVRLSKRCLPIKG